MANEIYNTSWWGNALDTARTAGTDPDFFGSQMKLLTSEQDNSVSNGDMELDCCWSDYASGTTLNERTTAEVHTGTYSRVYTTSTTTTGGIQSSYFFVGKSTYKLQFWVYPVDRNSQRIAIRNGSGGAWAKDHNFTGLTLNEWNLCEIEYENTVKGDNAYIVFHSNAQAGTWYIDDVSLIQIRCDYDGVSGELVQNGSFNQIGSEEITNGDFSQIGNEEVSNGDFSQVGSESLLNANFESSSGWNLNNDSYIQGTELYANTNALIYQSSRLTNGKWYKVEINVTSVEQDGFNVYANGTQSSRIDTAGVHILYIKAGTSNTLAGFNPVSHFIGVIRSFSFKEVGQDWQFNNGWSISNGKAVCDGTNSPLDQYLVTTVGKTYKVQLTVSDMTTASVNVRLGASSSDIIGSITDNGTYTFYGKVASNTTLRVRSTDGFDGSVDNISVKEVGQDWNWGDGWNINDGTAICTELNNNLTQDVGVSSGKLYKVTLDVTEYTSGTLAIDIGGSSNQTTSSVGSKTFYFKTSSTGHLRFYGGSFRGSIDNISVKEVGQNWSFGTGWNMGDGKAVFDGFNNVSLQQDGIVGNGKRYRLTYTILDYVQGGIKWRFGLATNLTPVRSANGTYVEEIVADGTDFRAITDGATKLSIDNVSVVSLEDHVEAKKCLADWIHRTALEDLKY